MRKILLLSILLGTLLISSCTSRQPIRLLYWNIQNGMWADQPNNYDNFVEFVKSQHPDICVWAEAKSLYFDGTSKGFTDDLLRYLPSNWDVLAARYGHDYVYLGGYRDNYPQVITSRYPIKNMKRIVGELPDSLVAHGAGWAQIEIQGKTYNIVTLHTWPMSYTLNASNREESTARGEGNIYRRVEMEYICNNSVLTHPNASNENWLMMGDFNSVSRVDNDYYQYPADSTAFLTHDFIREQTPYRDVVKELHSDGIEKTTFYRRIDFVYATPAMMDHIVSADVIREGYPKHEKLGISNFWNPSDHLPILVVWK